MKIFKVWSIAVVLLIAMVACEKPNNNNGGGVDVPTLTNVDNEWKLVSVNGVEPEFTVYLYLESGIFNMYQQIYTLDYLYYEGDYTIKGDTLSGVYVDGSAWKCDYQGSVSEDGNTLTLVSKESNPITCVYEACEIPMEVITEALTTRSMEFVPFL
ncbi:MAG: hypothetical protein IKY74_02605 [Alistipes sp.]|nr:hypothetical protein [Alistipes sp.]